MAPNYWTTHRAFPSVQKVLLVSTEKAFPTVRGFVCPFFSILLYTFLLRRNAHILICTTSSEQLGEFFIDTHSCDLIANTPECSLVSLPSEVTSVLTSSAFSCHWCFSGSCIRSSRENNTSCHLLRPHAVKLRVLRMFYPRGNGVS